MTRFTLHRKAARYLKVVFHVETIELFLAVMQIFKVLNHVTDYNIIINLLICY